VFLGDVLVTHGRTDNIALRYAATIALAFNLLMVIIAIISITVTVPKSKEVETE
jgi:DHA2 family multidrug resistance protein-like MFS transporter